MAKDPAVLFYPNDFLGGVKYMSMEDRGKYITLLCDQFVSGHIPEDHMLFVCLTHDSPVIKKFIKDDKGLYYNERMELEKELRLNYCKSRSNPNAGRKKLNRTNNHTKTVRKSCGNRTEDVNENKDIDTIISYFNKTIGTKYSNKTVATIKALNARLKDYSIDDIKLVINNRYELWNNDEKMRQHLTPATIFRAQNFEKYFNSTNIKQKSAWGKYG